MYQIVCEDCARLTGGRCARHSMETFITTTPVPRVPHKCPVCDGAGLVSRPSWVPGDQREWTTGGTTAYPCRACQGTGIVWEIQIMTVFAGLPEDHQPFAGRSGEDQP